MREQRLIAEHRGGPLTKAGHHDLMRWACDCAQRVLPLIEGEVDERLLGALQAGRDWAEGGVRPGNAMKNSVAAHAAARELRLPAAVAVARSIGQAAGTAHFAEHAIGAALYALKATRLAGRWVEDELAQQTAAIPPELVDVVVDVLGKKAGAFKLAVAIPIFRAKCDLDGEGDRSSTGLGLGIVWSGWTGAATDRPLV